MLGVYVRVNCRAKSIEVGPREGRRVGWKNMLKCANYCERSANGLEQGRMEEFPSWPSLKEIRRHVYKIKIKKKEIQMLLQNLWWAGNSSLSIYQT